MRIVKDRQAECIEISAVSVFFLRNMLQDIDIVYTKE